jgi:hypothetical protein
VGNALHFKAVIGQLLSVIETNALEHEAKYLSNKGLISSSV